MSESGNTKPERITLGSAGGREYPYPIIMREARYGPGVYCGGQWTLVAGLRNPDENTEAWGSDTACNSFWTERSVDGPEFTATEWGNERQAFAVAGDNPTELVKTLLNHYSEGSS